ncbi:hypothetical protein BKA82DRAFT_1003787, partial [Pisolithus tinctorius]
NVFGNRILEGGAGEALLCYGVWCEGRGEHGNTKPPRRSVVRFTRGTTSAPIELAWYRGEYRMRPPGIAMTQAIERAKDDRWSSLPLVDTSLGRGQTTRTVH